MPNLKLSNKTKSVRNKGIPGIIKDNLVLSHDYQTKSVIPVSDGAAFLNNTGSGGTNRIETSLAGNTAFADSFTISAWIYRIEDDGADYHTIFAASDGTNDRVSFYIQKEDTGSDLILVTGAGSASYCHSIQAYNYYNKWTHIAASYEDGSQKIYINGVDDTDTSSTNTSTFTPDLTDTACIGGASTGSCFYGYICNVGLWSAVLTQAQIKSIMNKNYAGLTDSETENLVSWWNLDETIETTNISDEPNIVLDNNASNTEVLNWKSNFGTSGIVENADTGNFDVNADPPYTESYIDNDNYTVRLRALLDGPDDNDAIDHIQVKTIDSLTAGKSYKIVVTVDSISGRFRIRPGNGSADADITTVGVHTFYFHKSPSTYWRLERDVGVGDITVSDIKIYDIGNIGELS